MNSSVGQLISSLKKELVKAKENNPTQYYICCSKQLPPQKVKEIYDLFSEYMDSEANILTLTEIDAVITIPNSKEETTREIYCGRR